MPVVENTPNCGVYFLDGVREFNPASEDNPVEFFQDLDFEMSPNRRHRYVERTNSFEEAWRWPGMIMFSDAKAPRETQKTAGDKFAAYLRKHNLGRITATGWVKNPNTKNLIKVWTWFVEAKRLDKHIQQLRNT